jgi:hypothetical protein
MTVGWVTPSNSAHLAIVPAREKAKRTRKSSQTSGLIFWSAPILKNPSDKEDRDCFMDCISPLCLSDSGVRFIQALVD